MLLIIGCIGYLVCVAIFWTSFRHLEGRRCVSDVSCFWKPNAQAVCCGWPWDPGSPNPIMCVHALISFHVAVTCSEVNLSSFSFLFFFFLVTIELMNSDAYILFNLKREILHPKFIFLPLKFNFSYHFLWEDCQFIYSLITWVFLKSFPRTSSSEA